MVNLTFALCRLFGHHTHKEKEIRGLVKSLKDLLLPLSEEAIDLRVKIALLQKHIDMLESKRRHVGVM